MEFYIPDSLDQLLDQPPEGFYQVADLVPVAEMSANEHDRRLHVIKQGLFSDFQAAHFDSLFSYLYFADQLEPALFERIEEIVVAGLNTLIDNLETLSHSDTRTKPAMKMYVLLLCSLEAARQSLGPKPARVLAKLAACDLMSLWRKSPPEEAFFKLLQDMFLLKVDKENKEHLPRLLQWLLDKCSKDSWIGWRTRVIGLLFTKSDKQLESLTDIICSAATLACDLLIDVVKAVQNDENLQNESDGAKNVGAFIEKFARVQPREIQTHVSSLISLLDCENYSIRNSVVLALGSLLEYLIKADQSDNAESETTATYREQLLSLLESRSLDRTVHCRTKVLEVFASLTDQKLLPRHRFLTTLKLAKDRLCDTGVFVRKRAAVLIEKLVINNKFSVQEFESVEEIETQLLPVQEKKARLKAQLASQVIEDDEDPDNLKQLLRNEEMLEVFLTDYLEMLELLTSCCSVMYQMLNSKQQTDVAAAVEGLTVLHIANLPAAAEAFNRMLPLIWSKEAGVRNRISSAFSSKYLNLTAYSEQDCATKLYCLIDSLTVGELSSLEDLFVELFKANLVPVKLLREVWKNFKEAPQYSVVVLLRFISRTEQNFLHSKYKKLLSHFLILDSWVVFAEALLVVQNLGYQSSITEEFFNKSISKLMNGTGEGWHCAAQQLIKAVEDMSLKSFDHMRAIAVVALGKLYEPKVSEEVASQGVFVAGEVALRVLKYGDKLKTKYKEKFGDSEKTDDLEEISGGRAALLQQQLQYMTDIQDQCILGNTNLLGLVVPVIESLGKSLPSLKNLMLQQAALLTLAKFMCVSQQFCSRNLGSIFSVLEGSLPPSIKCNAVIAFGDLTLRYPNSMEEHSERLFSCLGAAEVAVRKKAMLVVTHLVLNDMLKMRGQMADVMLTLLDPEVKNSAKTFFNELHLKDKKTIQNLLPDSLSRLLSRPDLSHADFNKMVEFVFKFVDKAAQNTTMIEKLCQRMVQADSATAEKLAYCLSQLSYDEKAMRRLMDFESTWQRLFFENATTLQYFQNIAADAKKNLKNEHKCLASEFEAKLSGTEQVRKRKKP